MKQKTLITRWLLMLIALLPLSVVAESTQLARWTFDTGYDVASNVYTPNTSDWAQVGWNGFGSTFKVRPNASVGDASNYYVTEKGTRYWGIMDNNGDKIMSLYQDLDPNNITDYTDASQHNQYFEIAFPTTGYKNISVSFAFTCGDNTARNMEMVVSTDGGQTWSDVGAYAGAAYWWIYNNNNVSISANNKESVIVRLIAENDATAQWRMNEISITGEEDVNNNTGTNKKVHTIGDSTMAPYNENETVTRGWGMYFGNFLTNGWTSQNYARGGRDARSGYNELWTQNAKANVEEGDYVLIQFAHNDEMFNGIDNLELMSWMEANNVSYTTDTRGTIPSTTYKALLKQIVDEVKALNAHPVLVGPVCRKYFDSNGKIRRNGRHDLGDAYSVLGEDTWTYNEQTQSWVLSKSHSVAADNHLMDYPYHMKALAEEEDIPYIDLTTATKDLYESYGEERCTDELFSYKVDGNNNVTSDGTHFNTTGALLAARLCAQLMKEQGILADNINVPTDLTVAPATADMGENYVGMTLTKELTINGFGLDPASGTITITAPTGIEVSFDKNNWKQELTVDYSSGTLVKSFHVRVVLASVGEINGTITLTNGTQNVEVPVTATGIEVSTGAPVSVTWPLSENNTATVAGPFEAAQTMSSMESVDFSGNMQRIQVAGGSWNVGEDDDPSRYVSFSMTSTSDNTIKINGITMKVGAQGGNSLNCHIYYSTDGFQNRTTIAEKSNMSAGTMYDVNAQTIISLEKGQTLDVRVYPWSTEAGSGKYLCLQDVDISGVEEGVGLENEPVTITYKFDEGTEGQTATYGPISQADSWFKSNYVEVGNNLEILDKYAYVTGSYQTRFDPKTKTNSHDDANNNIDFVFIPKNGLVFTPTRVSFKATRWGTGGGNVLVSWVDGDGVVTQIDELTAIKRNNETPTYTEFSKEVTGVNATSGENRLRLNLWNLNDGKQVGFCDVVIEGTFTGTPQNVVQHRLTTSVNIDEAGSVTVTPAGIMFDEGDVVTVAADKNFGYRFVEWQDEDGNQVGTNASVEITMSADKTMNAIFEAVPTYKVTTNIVAKDSNDDERSMGSITLTPNEHNGMYEAGTQITATASTSPVLSFTQWEDNSTSATREITVNEAMTITANYEVNDFIAIFDASQTAAYANQTTAYPFSADAAWDSNRNAKSSIVRLSDGEALRGQGSTPVVRNRQSVVLSSINGLYQNGYNTAEIAWQYQFSTVGFTTATFTADMAAKNAATKNWKAQYSVDGTTYNDLGDAWVMTANVVKPLSFTLPADAIGKETVYLRIFGTGTEYLSTSYSFDAGTCEELDYATNSESGVGNVFILGDAEVVADEVAPVVVSTVPADNATGSSASGKITVTFDEKIYDANSNGAVTLTKAGAASGTTLTPSWSTKSVSFNYSALDYGTQYTFTMPANYVQDHSGNKYAEQVVINFTTMERPSVAKAMYDFIVPDMGTIDEALAAANNREDKTVRYRVFIKNSDEPYVFHPEGTVTGGDNNTYDNPTSVLTASNTSFIGESIEGVVLTNVTPAATWDNGFGIACPLEGIGNGDVLQIKGTDSYFQNLTIKTSMGDAHGRDIAVNDQSNRTIFKDAQLWGYQDTYVSNNQNGKFYFEGGVIRGRTDYMCGKGDVYYNKVTLRQIASGYAAVPSQPKQYGYIYQSCKIIGDSNSGVDGTYTLGRPWGKGTPIALFIDTEMEVKPSAIGWSEMSGGYPARFAEYGSHTPSGAAVSTDDRKTVYDAYDSKEGDVYTNRRNEYNNPILTAEEAAVPTLAAVMGQDDDWQPTLLTEQAPVPTNVSAQGMTLSWDDSNYALLWAVCKDGNVIDFTTTNSYEATEAGQYSVRAANEMGGLSAESATVTLPVTYETITFTGGVTTYVTQNALDFTGVTELTAYAVTEIKTSTVATQKVGQVPAGTPLLIKGESANIPVIESAEAITNLLQGSDGTVEGDGATIFAYSKSKGKFAKVSASVTIPAGKAYLVVDGNAPTTLDIDFEGEATGINNVNVNANSVAPVKVIKNGKLFIGDFNVAGQRVQ